MMVGRDPECEISSSDPRLSRKHAELRATPSGVVVRDLGSRNGVRVNDKPITEAVLLPGDVVTVAHLSLRLVDEVPTAAAPARLQGAPVAVAAPVEDDRTRAVAQGRARGGHRRGRGQARGRRRSHARAAAAARAAGPRRRRPRSMTAMPADAGEVVIRRVPAGAAAAPRGPAPMTEDVGVQSLMGVGWGRRVLAQGLLLAFVVFLIAAIPLLAWQARVFGASALQAWTVLLPPLAASAFAGVMVAGLIARTAVRGVQRDGRR